MLYILRAKLTIRFVFCFVDLHELCVDEEWWLFGSKKTEKPKGAIVFMLSYQCGW